MDDPPSILPKEELSKFSSKRSSFEKSIYIYIFNVNFRKEYSEWNFSNLPLERKTKNPEEEKRNYGERIFESADELRATWPPILEGLESWASITGARLGRENSSEAGLF